MNRSRKECLGGQACEPTSLPEALNCLIEHSPLDVTDLAAALADRGVPVHRAYLYELANAQRADRGGKGLVIAAAVTAITQRPVLLQYLCRANGGEFVQLPTVSGGAGDEARLAAETLREFAEAMSAFADGAADRAWTAEEFARLEREGHDAIERILQIVAHARGRVAALPARASKMAKATRRPVDPWMVAAGEQ